jgi:hypothetical protein
VHETASASYRSGAIDKATMDEFDTFALGFAGRLASMPNVGEDQDFPREQCLTSAGLFQRSDISERFYAVWYLGCIAVVPGHAHSPGYDWSYAEFVSPKTGDVYRSREECQHAR